jgi:hypothetical protein
MSIKRARLSFFLILTLLTGFLGMIPGYNGDMSFYIATALNFEGRSDRQAITGAKEVIQTELKDEKAVSHIYNLDHAAFNILDYYRIKPLYVLLVILFHRMGFSYIIATIIPSLISFFLIGCLVFYWSSKKFNPITTLLVSSGLMLMNPSLILARLSTPDALSNFFILVCLYRIYFEKKYMWTSLILMVTLLVRLDNFIAVLILLTLMRFWPEKAARTRMRPLTYFLFVLFNGIICLLVNFYFTSNFWWFRDVNYLKSFRDYGHQLLIYFLSLSNSMVPALVLLVSFVYLNGSTGMPKKSFYLLTAIASIIFARFLFFPSLEERFMTSFYLCGFLTVLDLCVKVKQTENTPCLAEVGRAGDQPGKG